jgi:NAD(P)-dependent dehydrogenase (short-subunit alcohol dehydrogenase family)
VIARGTMLMCKYAIPEMIKGGGGSIINISSGKSLGGDLDEPSYSAAKAAVNSLTRTISVQYGKQGIRCNTVSPGVILTALGKKILPEEQKATYTGIVNTPDLGEPEDIGHLVVFLASDKSKYITGQLISVDGGFATQNASVGLFRSLGEARHLNVVDAPKE